MPEPWRAKRRHGEIDTALGTSNLETRQLWMLLLNALSSNTPLQLHWIKSGRLRTYGHNWTKKHENLTLTLCFGM